jgi:hypothetical protein
MTTVTIDLPRLHPAQRTANSVARFVMYNCGRRFGKDVLMQYRAVKRTALKQPQGWFAPSYRMMSENYAQLYNILAPIVLRASKSDYRLELAGGGIIEFWSLDNYNSARGRKYAHVTINEAAASPNLMDAWNYVIRPTLADLSGGADFGSTPKGLNDFYTLWSQASERPDWARYHFTTYDNPHIPLTEIEAMRETMPERVFQQEIMAQFVEDGSFFQGIDKCCVIENPDTPDHHEGHRILAGLDWAMSEDFTVLTVICGTCGKAVDWYRINRMDYTQQRAAIIERLKRWPEVVLLPERNSIGQPNIEMLAAAGLSIANGPDGGSGFSTTASTKAELINRLAVAMERQEILLPVEYADELRAYEVTVTSTNPKFSAPTGQHDDRVMSAALAWWSACVPLQIF